MAFFGNIIKHHKSQKMHYNAHFIGDFRKVLKLCIKVLENIYLVKNNFEAGAINNNL